MWPFRKHRRQVSNPPVGLDEVITSKPNLLRANLGRSKDITVWTAGDFADIRLGGVDDLGLTVDRRFSSAAAMFQAALDSVAGRERLHRLGEGPENLYMVMSEPVFLVNRTEARFRYILDRKDQCRFTVLVVCSWLRPLDRD